MKQNILLAAILMASFQLQAQTRIFPSTFLQAETPIAVNPTNPNNMIASAVSITPENANCIGFYYTTNGGQSWSGVDSIPGSKYGGDPVVAFDLDGVASAISEERYLRPLLAQIV